MSIDQINDLLQSIAILILAVTQIRQAKILKGRR